MSATNARSEEPVKPIRKILIANRGEIVVRIARTCADMGIRSVAVFSEADRHALHVRACDEAYLIGPAPATESYLRADRIVEVALKAGCDAVHPGYGFLSENAAFAKAVIEAGITWIGPSPEAITLMGSKIESKRLAQRNGVPVVPGYYGDDQSFDGLMFEAGRVGYPLLIKASAGGGGKGMRVVTDRSQLRESLEGARREAIGAFADGSLMLERYLQRPRHIEVQVLGDNHGTVLHLGERECSIQRRHQKVVEESPSPVVDEALRQRMAYAAVLLATAANYSNAGTIEFIYQDGEFYFLEMNTRLQVEHPVTEMALGLDLVEAQIRVASGERLWLAQDDIRFIGHAIECRLYAEDPASGFLPSTGTLTQFRGPLQDARLDSGVSEGDEVTPYYDPMLAKLICAGSTRSAALASMQQALDTISIEGVRTNLDFLRWLVGHPRFRAGDFSTRFIEEEYKPGGEPDVPSEVVLGSAAAFLLDFGDSFGRERDVWTCNPWRQARQMLTTGIIVESRRFDVTLSELPVSDTSWHASARLGERQLFDGDVELSLARSRSASQLALGDVGDVVQLGLSGDGHLFSLPVRASGDGILVSWGEHEYWVRLAEAVSTDVLHAAVHLSGEDTLESPMPGKVLKVLVSTGDEVEEDQPLMVIEAMKMEFTVRAPHSGRVAALHFREGEQVTVGTVLAEMEKQ